LKQTILRIPAFDPPAKEVKKSYRLFDEKMKWPFLSKSKGIATGTHFFTDLASIILVSSWESIVFFCWGQVYICEVESDIETCTTRNIHKRTEKEVMDGIGGCLVM
jgi:hypothetical protein